MADLGLGVAKSVVEGTLAKVQSAIETEKKLQRSAQSDLAFITEEFQMMQSFLDVVGEERAKNKVVKTWVGQVRDLAYDVEDGMEFVAHLDNESHWWRRLLLPCMALPLDQAVAELKQLKARVEDVSQRNIRYNLISDSGFKAVTQQQPMLVPGVAVGATSVDILGEATANAKMQQDLASLTQLITREDGHLRVISAWGTGGGDLAYLMSIFRKAYQTIDICQIFTCRGWVKLTHPLNPHEVLRSLMVQFYANSCLQNGTTVDVDELTRMEETAATQVGIIKEFMAQVNEKRFLVVLENVSTMGEWDAIRTYLPDRKNGSLIIVSTQQCDIANLCIGDSHQVLKLKQYSTEQSVCVFFKEGSQGNEADRVMTGNNEISTEDEVSDDWCDRLSNRIPISKKNAARTWMEQFTIVGRESQMSELRSCQIMARFKALQVMSVWGMAGVGKSILVRYLCCSRILDRDPIFDMYSWIDLSHPFSLRDFCESLLSDLHSESPQATGIKDPILMCNYLLKERRCLVVIDDLQSDEEWDLIRPALVSRNSRSVIIVITNEASIATHCADSEDLVISVKGLEAEAAFDLFNKEVCRKNPSSPLMRNRDSSLLELISKCGGIPKVIVAIADFLAPKTVTCMDSIETLNVRFMRELESNPELFGSVRGLFGWMNSYIRTCPDFLKQCILYLLIFRRDQIIRRRRIVRRWIAESYCKDTKDSSVEERGEWSFSKLVDLNMIQQPPYSVTDVFNYSRTVLCHLNSFVSEYMFSRSMEENLVLELKGSWPLTTQRTGCHLVIDSSWDRDRIVFESIDFSRLRSLTVFGEWKSFFISESMKVLRVLDLEDASGVTDKDIEKMVKLLPRLKFLSLRGCSEICHLPSSLGGLRQLETLDVRNTSVVTVPANITKLKKLQYIRAGTTMPREEQPTAGSSSWLPNFSKRQQLDGVMVTTGIGKLTALHTLGVVNVSAARGKDVLKELGKLTQLRKLGVSGINKKNSKELCSAISCHAHLESL